MKIVVCVKQVPDTETKVVIPDGGTWIDDTNVNYVLNPYDEFAVEEAIKAQEKFGGEVIIVSAGPERAATAIRNALAMGANSGIHVKIDGVYMGLAVAKVLADTIRPLEPDVVLFGKQAVDDDNHQIGPMVAELLDLPSVNIVTKLELTESGGTAERGIEGGKEVVEFPLPALITAHKGLNEPRYASLKGIMMAKKKPLEEKAPDSMASGISIQKMEYPPKRAEGKVFTTGAEAAPEVVKLLREEAKII
ncbi:electron transfer flavoprotein subunit beta/FixA family protein [candidate division KSB1 bacterium]